MLEKQHISFFVFQICSRMCLYPNIWVLHIKQQYTHLWCHRAQACTQLVHQRQPFVCGYLAVCFVHVLLHNATGAVRQPQTAHAENDQIMVIAYRIGRDTRWTTAHCVCVDRSAPVATIDKAPKTMHGEINRERWLPKRTHRMMRTTEHMRTFRNHYTIVNLCSNQTSHTCYRWRTIYKGHCSKRITRIISLFAKRITHTWVRDFAKGNLGSLTLSVLCALLAKTVTHTSPSVMLLLCRRHST